MFDLTATRVDAGSLPIIDIGGLFGAELPVRVEVGAAIRAACLDKGFFYISGHGVPNDLIASAFEMTERFFDLPEAKKLRLHKKNSIANRGYEPIGGQRLEDGAPPDLKESFFLGNDDAPDDPRVLARAFGRGPNQWPELPGFREIMERYTSAMRRLGQILYRGLALSLDVPETFFDDFYREPMNVLRLIHYPQQPSQPLPRQKGCGAHTDFGGVTILAQDEAGGLQVWDKGTEGWIHAPPTPGTFVVNLGDFMSRWTNGLYKSTLHRVVNTSGRDRYSIPFFVNGSPDIEVACIPTCLGPGEASKYPPTTVSRHFAAMYAKTYLV